MTTSRTDGHEPRRSGRRRRERTRRRSPRLLDDDVRHSVECQARQHAAISAVGVPMRCAASSRELRANDASSRPSECSAGGTWAAQDRRSSLVRSRGRCSSNTFDRVRQEPSRLRRTKGRRECAPPTRASIPRSTNASPATPTPRHASDAATGSQPPMDRDRRRLPREHVSRGHLREHRHGWRPTLLHGRSAALPAFHRCGRMRALLSRRRLWIPAAGGRCLRRPQLATSRLLPRRRLRLPARLRRNVQWARWSRWPVPRQRADQSRPRPEWWVEAGARGAEGLLGERHRGL
ncbi:MAG: hypothetical protein JWM74_2984 [Myxococcaceae bacterium]|nr:hypothetical protein [Myxococcaceae bacterium]